MAVLKEQEVFDIFDDRMRPVGTATRAETHAKGLWHRTFHCWIISREEGAEPALLLQLRHPDKDTFPGLLDISAAGHLLAGESPEDGVRELEEELGVTVSFDELIHCGVFAEEEFIGPSLIDREFCYVYLYPCDLRLSAYRMQPDEVTGLFRIALADVRSLVGGDASHVRAIGVEADPAGGGTLRPSERWVSSADVTPHPREYYDLLFAAIDRLQL